MFKFGKSLLKSGIMEQPRPRQLKLADSSSPLVEVTFAAEAAVELGATCDRSKAQSAVPKEKSTGLD